MSDSQCILAFIYLSKIWAYPPHMDNVFRHIFGHLQLQHVFWATLLLELPMPHSHPFWMVAVGNWIDMYWFFKINKKFKHDKVSWISENFAQPHCHDSAVLATCQILVQLSTLECICRNNYYSFQMWNSNLLDVK